MAKGRFYSRRQGWINIDPDVNRMRVYTSRIIEIPEEYMEKIIGLSGNEIIIQNISCPALHCLAKIFRNWVLYKADIDIGCFTRL